MNAVLIGFTSSGKTVTGRLLAERLDLVHVDLDDCIATVYQQETGADLSVRNIFRKLGAEAFEAVEHRALKQVASRHSIVLSTGGRAPINPANNEILRSIGKIIYLRPAPEVVFERMQAKGLPIFLRDDPTLDNLKRFWQQRDPIYTAIADFSVDTTHLSPHQTVDVIITEFEHLAAAKPCRK